MPDIDALFGIDRHRDRRAEDDSDEDKDEKAVISWKEED